MSSSAVCRAAAIALTGLDGAAVFVEAALSQQLPGIAIIGLPDAALAEAKSRVKVATEKAGLKLADRFILINLAPAALPKQGSGFDLAIALAALAASEKVPSGRMGGIAHLGELGLDGELRRPPGLLSAVLAARRLGFDRVMVPEPAAVEASLVPGIETIAVRDLADAVAWHSGEERGWRIVSPKRTGATGTHPSESARTRERFTEEESQTHHGDTPDMSDIVGQSEAVEALVVAAAGRHHLALTGPPGAGKTLLAARLPTILPDLTPDESLVASSIASLGNDTLERLVLRPPFEQPHHTASAIAIIGGGDSRGVRPGAITRACHGVLFLDEAPEYPRHVLDALRQPLESGSVEIHRSRVRATLPARTQLLIALNPCPCGNADSRDSAEECRCTPIARMRYHSRISGPLTDRLDLRIRVRRVSSVQETESDAVPTTSAELRTRVMRARERAAVRLDGTPWSVNSELPGQWLRGPAAKLSRAETTVLDRALALGALTLRGYDRTLRVAWTLADLDDVERPGRAQVARALALRDGEFS